MDRIIKDGEKLGPKDNAERVALFRVQVIGPLLARDFQDHGELAEEIRAIAAKWHRPPESALGRRYSAPTVERWYYVRIPEALEQLFRNDLNARSEVKSGRMGNTLPGRHR
jgi:hypothetical protein